MVVFCITRVLFLLRLFFATKGLNKHFSSLHFSLINNTPHFPLLLSLFQQLFAEENTKLRRDDEGYIYTIPGSTVTSITGVYAAGDGECSKQ